MRNLKTLLFGAAAGLACFSVISNDANAAGPDSSIQSRGEMVLAQAEGAKGAAGARSSGGAFKGGNNAASRQAAPAARAVRGGEGRSRAKASGGTASGSPVVERKRARETSRARVRQDNIGQPNRRRDGVARGGSRNFGGRNRGTRYSWGPGALFYFYDGYYHGDCSWLRRKAATTGSNIWLRRYRQCRAYN